MTNRPSEDFFAEYQSATSGRGFLQLQDWTTISIKGADRSSFLHNMCTNEICKLNAGDISEAFLTDVKGKIVAHVFISVQQEEIVLLTVPNQAEQIISHLDRYIIREDVSLNDVSEQFSWLAVFGTETSYGNAIGDDRLVLPQTLLWPQGLLVRCPNADLEKLTGELISDSTKQVSPDVWQALRVESGMSLFSVDFDNSNLPQEIDRNPQAINFNKGCYLGQETIARLDALGHVNKKIVGLQFADQNVPKPGTNLYDIEKEVGTITSASWSPQLDAPLAMAMVRRSSNELGKKLKTSSGEATVVSFPGAPRA